MITIDLLKNNPEDIPQLANIWQHVLGSIWLPDVPIEQVKQNYLTHLNDNEMPLTFVAHVNNQPVGMCSLRENDGIRPDLLPWLGSLVVNPEYQKQGIAKLLIDATKQKAKQLGFEKLYLFTLDPTIPTYYQKLGWQKIDVDHYKKQPVKVMSSEL